MAEWFKAHDWKSCDAGMYPEVQILFSAPKKNGRFFDRPFSFLCTDFRRGFEGGKNFSGEKLFCLEALLPHTSFGKTRRLVIVYWGASAKGANPLLCARKIKGFSHFGWSSFFMLFCHFFTK